MNVKLKSTQKIKISQPDDIYKVMQQVLMRENKFSRAQEHFWIIGLNNHNKILFIELLALGAHNRANVTPPDVFRMAIYKLATRAVLVHNHPSGSLEVSPKDKETTDYLYKAGKFLRIDVLDHLVISEKKYVSFARAGIMDEIRNSGAWELVDKNAAENLQNMVTDIEKERDAINSKLLATAKKLKVRGMPDQEIKELTGLKLAEIRKL
jgi:DNA repair protein RadC